MNDFKLELIYPDTEGKTSTKELTVRVNTPKLKDKSSSHYNPKKYIYELSFSLKIPDFIHSEIIGKEVPNYGIGRSEEMKSYPKDYTKTISTSSIESLTQWWYEIVAGYVWLRRMEKAELTKVIYYSFNGEFGATKSFYDGKKLGSKTDIQFLFMIGYVSAAEKEPYRYNEDKKRLHNKEDKVYTEMKYVEWTPEREVFFNNLEKSFNDIGSKMNQFEQGLSEDSINEIMSGNFKLLG